MSSTAVGTTHTAFIPPRVRGRERNSSGWNGSGAARALGWFSVGLGLAELMAPHSVGRAIGVRRPWTLRALGMRELASGVAILTQPERPAWLWSRVAGDAMDLALLGSAFRAPEARRVRLATAVGAVGLVTALDVACSRRMTQESNTSGTAAQPLHVSIAIERSAQELYQYWRDFTNLPRFMRHLQEVRVSDPQHSHWIASTPLGGTLEWDSELTEDRSGELLSWRSLPGSEVSSAGTVRFEPALQGDGSIVHLQMQYEAPSGPLGSALSGLLKTVTREQLKLELRRFKQLMETGEFATTDGQPSGQRGAMVRTINRAVQP
jgi:uncharacterized membrane protein